MQLDDVIATTLPDADRVEEAMNRSIRWLDRCIAAHTRPEKQNLFCIIQGGLDLELRKRCCEAMIARGTPGIAIGGLSGGEAKDAYCKVVNTCTALLPQDKPRYVMGVVGHSILPRVFASAESHQGYPEDMVVSVALGADMFDCVWPTRTAVTSLLDLVYYSTLIGHQRFGNAITSRGTLKLRHSSFAEDFSPIESGCTCVCCRTVEEGGIGITRAYIHHLAAKETAGAHLLTMHNVHYLLSLMRSARIAIIEDRYPAFLKGFFGKLYGDRSKFPPWAITALKGVGVDLLTD
jgi:queuine tRNA-ribosyltransferase catalytic subunit